MSRFVSYSGVTLFMSLNLFILSCRVETPIPNRNKCDSTTQEILTLGVKFSTIGFIKKNNDCNLIIISYSIYHI